MQNISKKQFLGVTSKHGLRWKNKNYKLKPSIALAMPRVSVADPGKGGGFQGVHPPVEMNLHVQKCFSNLLTICFEVEIVTTEGSHRRSIICVQY